MSYFFKILDGERDGGTEADRPKAKEDLSEEDQWQERACGGREGSRGRGEEKSYNLKCLLNKKKGCSQLQHQWEETRLHPNKCWRVKQYVGFKEKVKA